MVIHVLTKWHSLWLDVCAQIRGTKHLVSPAALAQCCDMLIPNLPFLLTSAISWDLLKLHPQEINGCCYKSIFFLYSRPDVA
jgi:hypothetical protein